MIGRLVLCFWILLRTSAGIAASAPEFPSLLDVRDDLVNLKRRAEAHQQGKTIFGADTELPNKHELDTYNWSALELTAKSALLEGDTKKFGALLNSLKSLEGIYDDTKSRAIVLLYHHVIQADLRNVEMADFQTWFDIASKTMRKRNIPEVKSSLLYFLQDLRALTRHVELLSKQPDTNAEHAYAAWLLSRLDPTDEHLNQALKALERAQNSELSDDASASINVYHAETLVRKAVLLDVDRLSGVDRTDALSALKSVGKTVADCRKSTDLLEYPLLFGLAYQVTADYFELMGRIAQPETRANFEQRKELAQSIADEYR